MPLSIRFDEPRSHIRDKVDRFDRLFQHICKVIAAAGPNADDQFIQFQILIFHYLLHRLQTIPLVIEVIHKDHGTHEGLDGPDLYFQRCVMREFLDGEALHVDVIEFLRVQVFRHAVRDQDTPQGLPEGDADLWTELSGTALLRIHRIVLDDQLDQPVIQDLGVKAQRELTREQHGNFAAKFQMAVPQYILNGGIS